MLDRLFGYKVHPFLQLLGMVVLAIGLPMNKVLMSIGTIWLASNLVLKADFRSYWKRWKTSKLFWFIVGILLLHLVGLTYTEDLNYAFRDLNTKLPLFVIPIAIIAYPIRKEWLPYILYFYLASLCITSTINLITDWTNPQSDFRSLSQFGSHIRYTILIVMGILVGLHLFQTRKKFRLLWVLIIAWLIFYVYQSQVFSGYVSLIMLILAFLIYHIFKIKKVIVKNTLLLSILVSLVLGIFFGVQFFTPHNYHTDFSNLPEKTPYDNRYLHDTAFVWYENGHHVMSYISEKELRKSWNERASIDYDSLDKNGHKIKSTLIRYMTSKGLKKDHDGMKKMSDDDVKNVEKGYTNIKQVSRSPMARLENLKNEIHLYNQTGNPNGNSITERIEHFKVGELILQDHWLFGVGTGDVQQVFNEYYSSTNTKLDRENWNRAHNQFLTFWISFGIIGFLFFSALWYYLTIKALTQKSFLALGFVFIAVGSFLSEDTIETQQGVTFIAFFLAISHLYLTNKDTRLK